MCHFVTVMPTISGRKWLRYTLVAMLTIAFTTFLFLSWEKYDSRLMAVSMRERPQTSFVFPTVAICGVISNATLDAVFHPEAAKFEPWILGASQDYVAEEHDVTDKKQATENYERIPE